MSRRVWTLLLVLGLAYAGVCALLFCVQDRMVFPGAGRGDRGVPPMTVPAKVEWIDAGEWIDSKEPLRARALIVSTGRPGPLFLYFGGNGEDLTAAAWTIEQLARYGGEVIGVEYPGYGATPGSPSQTSLRTTARAAFAFASARAADTRAPLCVVGSSLGSHCAVYVAAVCGADKLVLRAPPTTLAAVAKKTFWWLPIDLLLRHRFDTLAEAGGVKCPVLVVHGELDTIVPIGFGRELASALRATFVAVPGCGHNDLDLSPDGPVGRDVRAFLTGM